MSGVPATPTIGLFKDMPYKSASPKANKLPSEPTSQ
jgi:hypothetical protein